MKEIILLNKIIFFIMLNINRKFLIKVYVILYAQYIFKVTI